MSEDTCETVAIVSPESPDGFIVINKSDYDPAVHKIFGCEGAEPETEPGKHSKRRR